MAPSTSFGVDVERKHRCCELELTDGRYCTREVFPNVRYLSPEALANALSQAEAQSLPPSPPLRQSNIVMPRLSRERIVLAAPTHLKFRGIGEFLDRFMANIGSPLAKRGPRELLGDPDIEIMFDRPIFTISKLGKSIDQIEMQKSLTYRRADILYSERAISISFTQPLAEAAKHLELRVCCEPLALQLSSMSLICKVLSGSALVLGVERLHLSAKRPSSGQDDSERKLWLEIIHHFRGTKWVHVAGDHSTSIALALELSNTWRETVLPSLHKLSIQEPKQDYVPLREAVLSFTHSRRLSGSFIGVEYEPLWIDELCGTGPSSQRTTIESLSDDILLDVFLHCLGASPKFWPTLVHVCQNWRQIVFTSPRSLHLQLCCKHGTPVLKTLDCWPALPITVQYGGSSTIDPPAPEDEGNVMAALRQSDRVSSISLTITDSLLAKLFTIEESFSELEEVDLLSQDNVQLTLPSTFHWGPRLRSLHLTRIAIPALPQLSSSTDLVDLQLYEIPSAGYISPEAFANALSGMTQLRSLSFHFLSLPPLGNFLDLPPSSRGRIVLPALTCLKYRGTSNYLDSLVARIDTPRLWDVDITFDQSTMDASQLGQFIDRIEMQRSPSQADIVSSQSSISIRFTHTGAPTRLGLRISCEPLGWQLSSMAQILNQFSHFSFRVENLGVNTTEPSSGQNNMGGEQWLNLIRAFRGAKDFRVPSELARDIFCALHPADEEHLTVLPALQNLRIRGPLYMSGSLWDAVHSFNTSRWLSSHPIEVYAAEYRCHRCGSRYKEQRGLKKHLKRRHAYRIVCSYCDLDCDDYNWSPESWVRFREHLESKHPEVAHKVAHIYEHISSQSFHHGGHGTQHNDRRDRDLDIFESSTTVKRDLRPNRGAETRRDQQREPTPPIPSISTETPTDA